MFELLVESVADRRVIISVMAVSGVARGPDRLDAVTGCRARLILYLGRWRAYDDDDI